LGEPRAGGEIEFLPAAPQLAEVLSRKLLRSIVQTGSGIENVALVKISGLKAKISNMRCMVIEQFKENAAPEIYRRLREKGRMIPEGLNYASSWIDHQLKLAGK
jgi:hypothetical protein